MTPKEILREKERIREKYRLMKAEAESRMIEDYKRQKIWEAKVKSASTPNIDELIEKAGGLEKLLEKIGIEKVETVLRSHKINKLKKKL